MFAFLSFALIIATPALAGDCGRFAGHWAPVSTGHTVAFAGLQIWANDGSPEIRILYNADVGRDTQFTESYRADGLRHAGDGHATGRFYTATCAGPMLRIVRDGLYDKTQITEFTVNGRDMDFRSGPEGAADPLVGKFRRDEPDREAP